MPSDDDQESNRRWQQALTTVGLALSIPFMLGLPIWFGWYIDTHYTHTYPLFLIIGLVLGFLSTALDIYKLLKRMRMVK
jgi:F0F1-type ATP synthase assembly protein I